MMLARGGSTVVVNGNIDGKRGCKELILKRLMTPLDREIAIGGDSRKFDYRFMFLPMAPCQHCFSIYFVRPKQGNFCESLANLQAKPNLRS